MVGRQRVFLAVKIAHLLRTVDALRTISKSWLTRPSGAAAGDSGGQLGAARGSHGAPFGGAHELQRQDRLADPHLVPRPAVDACAGSRGAAGGGDPAAGAGPRRGGADGGLSPREPAGGGAVAVRRAAAEGRPGSPSSTRTCPTCPRPSSTLSSWPATATSRPPSNATRHSTGATPSSSRHGSPSAPPSRPTASPSTTRNSSGQTPTLSNYKSSNSLSGRPPDIITRQVEAIKPEALLHPKDLVYNPVDDLGKGYPISQLPSSILPYTKNGIYKNLTQTNCFVCRATCRSERLYGSVSERCRPWCRF